MINDNNTNIFICCHKNTFDNPLNLTNKSYKILTDNQNLTTNSNLDVIKFNNNFDSKLYSEFSHLFWLSEQTNLKDYTGICHYRRYFDFNDNFEKLNNYNCVITKPEICYNNIIGYNNWHNSDDITDFTNFYLYYYRNNELMYNIWMKYINSNGTYTNNMVILPTEEFFFIFKEMKQLFLEYQNYRHLYNEKDCTEHVILNKEKYIKNFYPNNTIFYNIRFYSYLAERLTSAFIQFYLLEKKYNFYVSDKIITENKYAK